MFLRRLDLVGFKSFAPHTSTELLPGIVVVVGPNGSGKSNISDAVLWVLGEQSAKAVRARKPEEVIFAGSATRQPLGMAEVSLVLDNTDNSLPIEYAEVRVTRRLYRSGDSEYLLNGARVRLKDITQLLLHAGLSPDSYTVISQGSVDELILQRPDERRVVFENAADIRRYQLRLNDTRSKLGSTQANLVRVEDVLAELTPHVRRLKGQAERAERADTFRSELHDLLLRFFRARLVRAHQDRRQAEAELVSATTAAQQADAESLAGEESLRGVDQRLAALEERFSELRPRADGFREQARVTERSLAVTRERINGFAQQRSTLEADLVHLQGLLERLSVEEEEAARSSGQAPPGAADNSTDESERLASERTRLADAVEALNNVQAERTRAQHVLDSAERRIGEAEARLARTEQHQQSLQASLAVDQARQTDRQTQATNLEQRAAELQSEASGSDEQLTHARTRLEAASEARRQAAARLDQASEAFRAASQQADRLQGALAAMGAADLSRADAADLPPEWELALRDLPVVGLAGELASRIRPIDLQLAGYLRRIVVLANDTAAREAHRRLTTHLSSDAPAWAVLSMDGLLVASPGERPLESAGDAGLADWARQVRQLEDELTAAEAGRRAALANVQAARDGIDDVEANQQSARVALGEVEARLAELRRTEANARRELQQLQADQERAARAAAQRSDERARATKRAQVIRDELGAARSERDALSDALRVVDERVAALTQEVGQMRDEVTALEAAAGRREAERAAREALHARIQAEIASNVAARETASTRLEQLGAQQAELARARSAAQPRARRSPARARAAGGRAVLGRTTSSQPARRTPAVRTAPGGPARRRARRARSRARRATWLPSGRRTTSSG